MSSRMPVVYEEKANSIRGLLKRSRPQLLMAIPKHMSVDRLLRVAMTSIRTNPKLLDCTQESLLACIMGCAQLGLEPEPFLGQAYLVPFWNAKKNRLECQLIPGYRGYLALARRSGEVQSVTAQVVYEHDYFQMRYGLQETLEHIPAEGDRGAAKGAYVIFRYKDGAHSFDYMSIADIDKIKERSKSRDKDGKLVGPWVTDEDEMRKKTVIRRHIKLVPLSVEMATAAAAEDKAFAGESQVGLFTDTEDAEIVETSEGAVDPAVLEQFDAMVQGKNPSPEQEAALVKFLSAYPNRTPEQIKAEAVKKFDEFWAVFVEWAEKHGGQCKTRSDKGQSRGSKKDEPAKPESTTPPPESPVAGISELLSEEQGRRIEELLKDPAVLEAGFSKQTICYEWEVKGIEFLSPEQAVNVIQRLEGLMAEK
jgi:recombination protein RecT